MMNDTVNQESRRRLGNDVLPEQGHAVQIHLNLNRKDGNGVPNCALPTICNPGSDQL